MTDLATTLTTEIIDRIYQSFLEGESGRPKFTLVVSRRTHARLEDAYHRSPKRRARKKARNRRKK